MTCRTVVAEGSSPQERGVHLLVDLEQDKADGHREPDDASVGGDDSHADPVAGAPSVQRARPERDGGQRQQRARWVVVQRLADAKQGQVPHRAGHAAQRIHHAETVQRRVEVGPGGKPEPSQGESEQHAHHRHRRRGPKVVAIVCFDGEDPTDPMRARGFAARRFHWARES